MLSYKQGRNMLFFLLLSSTFNSLGIPQSLAQDELRAIMAEAASNVADDRARNLAGSSIPPPVFPDRLMSLPGLFNVAGSDQGKEWSPGATSGMGDWMRVRFPALRNLPDEMVDKLPLSTLLQLNEALVKDLKSIKKLDPEAKLALNAEECCSNPVSVPSGLDNRRDVLHQARFLGGVISSHQLVWQKAREVIGLDGIPALGGYDMDAVGCGGAVSPKGWLELHNPASTSLCLRQFHISNVSGGSMSVKKLSLSSNDESLLLGESAREIMDMEEFRSAMTTLREAMSMVLPWNKSVSAIQGFLNISNYCKKDLDGRQNRAALLTSFVNYVLGRNALNWQNKQPFLATNDLLHVWATWFGQQPASSISTSKKEPKDSKKREEKDRDKNDLCRRYNIGSCPTMGKECRTFYGLRLRHLCNARLSNGQLCEKDHPRIKHV